jgi:hypothetical protein
MPSSHVADINELKSYLSNLESRLDSAQKTSTLQLDTFRNLLDEQLKAKDIRVDLLKSEIDSLLLQKDALCKQNIDTLKGMNDSFERHIKSFQVQSELVNKQNIEMLKGMSGSFEKHNDALQKQIGFRFNFVTSMIGFITLALGVTFVYNKWQADKVDEAREFLEKGTKVLTENSKVFAEILGITAQADGLIGDGHREYQRAAYADAHSFAGKAIGLLEQANNKTGDGIGETIDKIKMTKLKDKSCQIDESSKTANSSMSKRDTFGGINPQILQRAVIISLVEAYDLQTRSLAVLLDNGGNVSRYGSYGDIRNNGRFWIAMDWNSWQGYHWGRTRTRAS